MNIFSLSAIDWFLLALAAISMFSAFRSGLVKTAFSLAGLIAGGLVATASISPLLVWLHGRVEVDRSTEKMIFLLIVLGVYAVFTGFSKFANKVAVGAGLELADRFLGAGFGLLRGALIAALVLVTISLSTPFSPVVRSSVLAPYLVAGTEAVAIFSPDAFNDQARPESNDLLPELKDSLQASSPRQTRPE